MKTVELYFYKTWPASSVWLEKDQKTGVFDTVHYLLQEEARAKLNRTTDVRAHITLADEELPNATFCLEFAGDVPNSRIPRYTYELRWPAQPNRLMTIVEICTEFLSKHGLKQARKLWGTHSISSTIWGYSRVEKPKDGTTPETKPVEEPLDLA